MSMVLKSSAFHSGSTIPTAYTCDGTNISPPLAWVNIPAAAKSLVLIVDDPDAPDPAAPKTPWVHWVLYDIAPRADGLPQAVDSPNLPPGTRQGINDWQRTGYGGPCPPIGRHRYVFKLYALDVMLPDLKIPGKARLEAAMEGHILERAELIGLYQRA